MIIAHGIHEKANGIDVVRAIRDVNGCSLVEAKSVFDRLIHAVPQIIPLSSMDEIAARQLLVRHGVLVEGMSPANATDLIRRRQRNLVEQLVESLGGKVTWGP